MRSGLILFLFFSFSYCYSQQKRFTDTAALYFTELKTVTEQNQSLWGLDLYAPLLLVNPVKGITIFGDNTTCFGNCLQLLFMATSHH